MIQGPVVGWSFQDHDGNLRGLLFGKQPFRQPDPENTGWENPGDVGGPSARSLSETQVFAVF